MLRVLRSSFITWISLAGAIVSGIASLGDAGAALGAVGGILFSLRLLAIKLMSLVAESTGIVIWSTNVALLMFLICVAGVAFGLRSWLLSRLARPDLEFTEWIRAEVWERYRERMFTEESPSSGGRDWPTKLPLYTLFVVLWISSYWTQPTELQVNQVILRLLLILAGSYLIAIIPFYLRSSLPTISYEAIAPIEKKWLANQARTSGGRTKLAHRGADTFDRMPGPVREYYKYQMLEKFLLASFRRCVYFIMIAMMFLGAAAYIATFGLVIDPAISALKLVALAGIVLIAMPFMSLFDASMLDHARAAMLGVMLGACIGIAIGLEGRARVLSCVSLGVFFGSVAAIATYYKHTRAIAIEPAASIARALEVVESDIAHSPLIFLVCTAATLIAVRVLVLREGRRLMATRLASSPNPLTQTPPHIPPDTPTAVLPNRPRGSRRRVSPVGSGKRGSR